MTLLSLTTVLELRRSLFAAQESREIAPIDCSKNASEMDPRSARNGGHTASRPSNIAACIAIQFARHHRASIIAHK